jgi:hypothetical protein
MRLSVATACFTTLAAAQMDISVLAARALRTMNLRQLPKPDMPLQVFGRSEEERRARMLMGAIGDPKIPVLGKLFYLLVSNVADVQKAEFHSKKGCGAYYAKGLLPTLPKRPDGPTATPSGSILMRPI